MRDTVANLLEEPHSWHNLQGWGWAKAGVIAEFDVVLQKGKREVNKKKSHPYICLQILIRISGVPSVQPLG